jgi:hypothetical protein
LGYINPDQVNDKGFLRQDTEHVIGKKYNWNKKAEPKRAQPANVNAVRPNDYSLTSCFSAALISTSSLYCKLK